MIIRHRREFEIRKARGECPILKPTLRARENDKRLDQRLHVEASGATVAIPEQNSR